MLQWRYWSKPGLMQKVSSNTNYRGVVAWFAQNSVAANVLMAALFVGGLLTLGSTNSEVFPQIDPRTVTVSVGYPGATPDEIVNSVTQRVDVAVMGLEGVDRVSSTATEGSGVVTVELKDFADAQTVKDDIQSAIDKLCLLYTSPSPRDRTRSRMPSSA